jgi:hypothetical protein
MNIVKTFDQFDDKCIYYCDPIKNNIINDGNFIRIIYSTPYCSLHGITLLISLQNVGIEKYYSKYKCSFNVETHRDLIEKMRQTEESVLRNARIVNKIPQFKIYDQFRNGNIKIFTDSTEKTNCQFMLKISGIWENDKFYGVTYKFVKIQNV